MRRRTFNVTGQDRNGVGVYFLNFFDEKFKAEYTPDGFTALNLPGLDEEIRDRIEWEGWRVDEAPTDLLTVLQASRRRSDSGSPLSEQAIRDAVAAGRLNRFTLPSHGDKLLVSWVEVEAYEPVGHKPAGYIHEKPNPLTTKEQNEEIQNTRD